MSIPAPLPNSSLASSQDLAGPSQELGPVLLSRAFEKTPTLKKLLAYMWEHRDDNISEYAIAVEALGRHPNFDPRLDATVRVLVSRLRQRLKEFYENEGSGLATRIVVPVGTHQVQIISISPEVTILPSAPADPVAAPGVLLGSRRVPMGLLVWIQAAVILLLLISNGWMLFQKNHYAEQAEALPKFWEQFLGNGKLTRIVVPNPVFFTWPNGLVARDKTVNDFSKMGDSALLKDLQQRFGSPTLSQQYISSPDEFASNRLGPYLDPKGGHILVSTTGEVSASDLNHDNLILLGTPNTLAPLQSVLEQLSFRMDVKSRMVVDRRSVPGMPVRFVTVEQSGTRITTPGIIACLPGGASGTHVLVLMTSYYTSALVSYLTSEGGLKELHKAQMAHGNPPYFEAVIDSEVEGSTALKQRLVAFRPYTSQPSRP